MQKHREPSPIGIVAISAIVTLLLLSALSYVFVRHVLPLYAIPIETVYSVLIRLLPISIGLLLVLIALVIAPPRIPKEPDETDMLEKDEYTAPLYNLPIEEEPILPQREQSPVIPSYGTAKTTRTDGGEQAAVPGITEFSGKQDIAPELFERELPIELRPAEESLTAVEEQLEGIVERQQVSESAPATVAYADVEQEEMVAEEPAAVAGVDLGQEELVAEEPAALAEVQEQPVETPEPFAEVPSISTAAETEVAARLTRAVLFGEFPYQIEPGSDIARLLEPVGESEPEDDLPDELLLTVEDTFEERLLSEMDSAADLGYDLTVARIAIPTSGTDTHAVEADVVQTLFNKIGLVSFFYLTDTGYVSAILPFHGFEQARRYFASLLESLRKQHPKTGIAVGFSSIGRRSVDLPTLLREVELASDVAAQRGGYSLIGYDDSLEAVTNGQDT